MSSQVVNSYASAFFETASESGKANRLIEEIDALLPLFREKNVVDFFKSPIFTSAEKEQVVAKALEGQIDPVMGDFIKLLARNGRLDLFPEIITHFKENCDGGQGSKKGEVFSGTELSDSEKQAITDAIAKKLNTPVTLDFKINPELIGGIEARVGSYIIEDSLRSNLKKLNDSLKRSSH